MAFGRKKQRDDEVDDDAVRADVKTKKRDAARGKSDPVEIAPRLDPDPTTGPWDDADAPDDGVSRVDLGALLVPVPEGVELRVDVNPEGQVVAATAQHLGSQMQLNVFAAPRRSGIWDDVRAEIRDALKSQGGSAEEVEGPFGTELRARVPSGQPGMTAPARFVGADGPRWFLRGLLSGPAATDVAQAGPLLEIFRNTVVVRGKDAMAPRDTLLLHLPKEAREAHERAQAQEDADEAAQPATSDDFNPFERGPEITEIQ
jgi:hypothetical protein